MWRLGMVEPKRRHSIVPAENVVPIIRTRRSSANVEHTTADTQTLTGPRKGMQWTGAQSGASAAGASLRYPSSRWPSGFTGLLLPEQIAQRVHRDYEIEKHENVRVLSQEGQVAFVGSQH